MIPKKRNKKKSKWGSVIFSTVLGTVFLLAIVFLFTSNLKINKKRQELISHVGFLQEETRILKDKNEELRAGISQTLKEDFLEKEARERFNLKKPEEEVVAVLSSETVGKKIENEPEKKSKKVWWNPLTWFKD